MIICKICGCENGDDFKFCRECGAKLTDDAAAQAVNEAYNMPEETVDTIGNDVVDNDVFEGSEAKAAADEEELKAGSDVDDDVKIFNPDTFSADNGKDSIDDISFTDDDDDDDDYEGFRVIERKNRRSKRNRKPISRRHSVDGDIAFIVISVVLIIATILLSGLYINRNFPGNNLKEKIAYMFSSAFSDEIITAPPTITASETEAGDPAIIITVYAKKGSIVVFQEGATRMERKIEGQSISFRVPISLWTSKAGSDSVEGLEIKPNVFVYDPSKSNEVIKLDFEPYHTAANTVDIVITSPDSLDISTTNSSVQIAGYVSDMSAAVFMNGEQLQLDEQGYFMTVYHVESLDSQRVVFTAQKGGTVVGSTVLNITYEKSSIDINITNESLRTFEDKLLIEGTVDKGAKLKVSGVELEGDLNLDKSTGKFSFTALLPDIGNYIITLSLSAGDTNSSVDIYAEHAPDMDEYIRGAWSLDYDWAVDHPTMNKHHYCIDGKIVEVYQSEPFVKARMKTADGDVIFTYYHTTAVEANDGKNYTLYAYLDGVDQKTGLIQLYCWFIHKPNN